MRAVGVVLWALAALCAAWSLVRSLGLERGFPLVPLVAWTPFLVPLAALCALGAALARRLGPAVLAAAATAALAVAVAPRAFGGGHEPPGATGPELRVVSANVLVGEADAAALAELARDADLVSLQEATPGFLARLRAELGGELPSAVATPEPGPHGGALLARHPLRPLGDVAPPGYDMRMPSAALRVPGAPEIVVASVHPIAPTSPAAVADWEEGLEALPQAGGARPVVLAGDFNATLDHALLRELIGSGYVDAADATGAGLEPTWPLGRTLPPLPIDHVLADERIAVLEYATHDLPGSDHATLTATLRLPERGLNAR